MVRHRTPLVPLVCLLLSAGAASAGPPLDLSKVDSLDLTGYRPLKRADFRGDHAPKEFLHAPVLPVAVSCIYVVVNPAARVYAEPVVKDGVTTYQPKIDGLSFQALLSRACSWWNDQHDVSPAYVLQHEQVHFALYEIAARRLNQQTDQLLRGLPPPAAEPHAAVVATQRYLQGRLNATMQTIVEQNVAFDRETSFGFQPARQQRWRDTVQADLKALEEHVVDLGLAPPVPGSAGGPP